MASRPKRIIKVKKRDDEIYTTSEPKRMIKVKRKDDEIYTSEPKRKRNSSSKVTKKQANWQNSESKVKQEQKHGKIPLFRLTDENAAIYRRIQESVKVEKDKECSDHADSSDDLPKKRIPKPSLKLRIKEEELSDEDPTWSDAEWPDSDVDDPLPKESLRKSSSPKKISVPNPNRIKMIRKPKSWPKKEKTDSHKDVSKEENVDEMTLSAYNTQSVGKDKIIQLPNNRTYFEFAEPKKKVILQINPTTEIPELKIQTLNELVSSLRLRNLISSDAQELLETFRELPDGLTKISVKVLKKLSKMHNEEVKKFATVLYLYTPKAYEVVNSIFCLPGKKHLQERLQTENYWPGFTQEALKLLKDKYPKDTTERICSIMLDFVTIKKEMDTLDDRWIGHVDFCGGPTPSDSDEVPMASEILLFTAVGIGRDWKLPFGYFLTNRLSGEALQSLVNEAIIVLEECGLKVQVLVCDGCPSTVKMGVLFGCNIHTKSYAELVTSFPHPLNEKEKIHLVFGIHHALHLLRNLLAERCLLRSSTYGIIKWKYFERLCGNSRSTKMEAIDLVDPDHIKFYHLQRIIRQCYPSFSCMENRAFELADDLKLEEYEGSTAAANFVADIYRAFDLLNSRNPVTTGEKPPIANPFLAEQLESMTVIGQRMYGLEFLSGKRVISDGRWMSVMLFAFTLKSVSILASMLLNEESLMYFTTYRLNLDHSDMMLSNIQRHGSWDGIPTAAEFRSGYKALFESCTELSRNSVFCNDFDGGDLTIGQGVICPFRRHLLIQGYDDIGYVVQSHPLTDRSTDIESRARCVIKHISQRLTCADCMDLLLDDDHSRDLENKKIILDYFRPSKFVIDILNISERVLKVKLFESRQVKVEEAVVHIFTEYLTNFGKMHTVSNDHVIEEPHHIIGIIKVVIRTSINYQLNSTKYLSVVKSRLLKGS